MNEIVIEDLLELVRNGDPSAAAELYQRYVDRMIHLARSRLAPSLGRRVDPEDVVQSACRSFFRRVIDGRYAATEDEQLWHLLAAITVGKARKAARRHTSAKRSVSSEESTTESLGQTRLSPDALAQEPSPEESAMLIEETERMMTSLTPQQRQIVQMLLQGHSASDIAKEIVCSERSVQRAVERARTLLEKALRIGAVD